MKKLSNIDESVWADIHKRSNGQTVRKEDETTNIREIIPLDLGLSVLWADRDLEWKNYNGCYFDYDEADNVVKNSGWRIPTKNESYELFSYAKAVMNTDDVCIIEGDFDNAPQLVFDKKGLQYGDSDKVHKLEEYDFWTSTETGTSETYYINKIRQFHCFVPMHNKNKVCVRLVKEK